MKNKKSKRKKSNPDINQLAHAVTERISKIDAGGKNPAAVALGRLGGLKGGKARAQSLSPQKRKEIAERAAQARWGKKEIDTHIS